MKEELEGLYEFGPEHWLYVVRDGAWRRLEVYRQEEELVPPLRVAEFRVPIEDELIAERARKIATLLLRRFSFVEVSTVSTTSLPVVEHGYAAASIGRDNSLGKPVSGGS